MNLHSLIIDDFYPDFESLRQMADCSDFKDVLNPEDGVVYPGICQVEGLGLERLLSETIGRPVSVSYQFMRLSLEGTKPPHWAHHDASMGEYSLMLYLNRAEHCRGGTALVEHAELGMDVPEHIWRRDTNRRHMWREISICPMAPNRAFIFRASMWHAALPIGGFGKDATDGRLVYTVFFS